MKSIFLHFSIPGSIYLIPYQQAITSTQCTYLKLTIIFMKEIVQHPLSFIEVMGAPVVFCVGALAMLYLESLNMLSKTPKNMILGLMFTHFKEVHHNLYSMNSGKTPAVAKYSMNEFLVYLFLSLAFINLGGMVHGTWCMTTWFSATIGLSLGMWVFTWLVSMYNYFFLFCSNMSLNQGEELMGLAGFFPSGTPLWLAPLMVIMEMLSWMMSFLSMGLRMAGNIVAGHVILGILSFAYMELYKLTKMNMEASSVSLTVMMQMAYVILTYFELAVAMIQAYVLTLLTSTFLKEMEDIH